MNDVTARSIQAAFLVWLLNHVCLHDELNYDISCHITINHNDW